MKATRFALNAPTPIRPVLRLSALTAALLGAFAAPSGAWAACAPPSPMTTAGGSVLCSGATAGQYQINASGVQFLNDSTGAMTLTGTSKGLIYANEGLADGVVVTNQGSMEWSGAVFESPFVGGRAVANIGYIGINNFLTAKFVNEVGATLSLKTADPRPGNGIHAIGIAAGSSTGVAEVVNNGTIRINNSATGAAVVNAATELYANSFTITNSGLVEVISTAESFTNGFNALKFTSVSGGGAGVVNNSGTMTIRNSHPTRTGGAIAVQAAAITSNTINNSGTVTIVSASPRSEQVGGLLAYGFAGSNGPFAITNSAAGSVVIDSANNYAYAARSGASSNATPVNIENSGLLEIKSSAAIPDASFRAAVMIFPSPGLTALHTITNQASGIIRADAQSYAVVAYYASPVHMSNAGTVAGKVELGDGPDELTQTSGTITGDINMGTGNDVMLANGGALVGSTTMGGGNDQLTLAGAVNVSQVPTFGGGIGTNDMVVDGLNLRVYTAATPVISQGNNLTQWTTLLARNSATLNLTGNLFETAAAATLTVDASATVSAVELPATAVNGAVALAGKFTHANSATGNVTTITGNLTATAGSVYALDTQLGDDSSATDRLVVNGNTSGATVVNVGNIGGAGALTTTGIEIVRVVGTSDGVFTLPSPGYITAGAFRYALNKVGNNWYLQSTPAPPIIDPPTTAAPIPTLGSFGLALLSLGFGWLGALALRSKRRAT